MNVHGALNHRVWRVGVHHVEDRMNYLIALESPGALPPFLFLHFAQGTYGSKTEFVEGEGLFPTIAAQDEWASAANWQLGQSRSQCKKRD
jgi:hypothetical protein